MAANPSGFGSLLRSYRLAAGMTQEQLAERAGLSAHGISNLERGVRRLPYRHTVRQLAVALQLSGAERAEFEDTGRASGEPVPDAPPTPGPSMSPGPVMGRVAERAALDRHVRGVGPPVMLLAGEPGIGKTRLLQEVVGSGQRSGCVVLAGGCQRWSRSEPFAPVVEAMERFVGDLDATTVQDALEGCGWLTRLLPELAALVPTPLPAGTLSSEQERRLVFAAVKRFLAQVSGPEGALLVLDDLQWAGSDGLDLLSSLVRSAEPGGVRVIGAYRDTEVAVHSPLHGLLADLAQAGLVDQIALAGLSDRESARVVGQLLSDADTSWIEGIVRRAGGVPFFLMSLAQSIQTESLDAPLPDTLPWDLTESLRRRTASLTAEGQTVLGVAAVVGRDVTVPLLQAVTDLPEDALVTALEAACGARLLEETGTTYRFVHDVILEVVEAELSMARRTVVHRRIAEALERQDDETPVERLAYHYVRADIPDKAVRYLELAGDRAAEQCANRVAEDYYREALERMERLRRADDVARVGEKLGLVLYRIGKYDAALALLEAAAAIYRAANDWTGLVRVTAGIGWAYAQRGTPAEGIAPLRALLQQLDQHAAPPPVRELHCALGLSLFYTGQYDEALAACERAIDLAPDAGVERTGILAEWLRMYLLILLGRLGAARQAGQETLPRAEALGDWLCLSMGHRYLAELHILCGELDMAQEHVTRSMASATALGAPAQISLALTYQGWIGLLRGEWPAARTALEQALALSNQLDGRLPATHTLFHLGRLHLAEGDWATGASVAGEAAALARRGSDLQGLRWASGVLAEIEIVEGRAEAASARLVPLLDRPGLQECDVTMLLPVLAWAQLELGQVDEAAETVEQALTRARPEEMRLVLVEALRVQALVAIRRERWTDARRDLGEGLALAQEITHPYAEARLLQVDGQRHAGQGEWDQAQVRLEAALTIFRRSGAVADARRVEQALSELTTREHAKPTSIPGGQMCALS
jgi:tetratricopeptide (TPR) repeat protein/DNA-binding XRE family transcriptional regulator